MGRIVNTLIEALQKVLSVVKVVIDIQTAIYEGLDTVLEKLKK